MPETIDARGTTRRQYWNTIAGQWLGDRDVVWRQHSDAVNSHLCRRWLPPTVSRLLKTDAFDEAVGAGLLPALRAIASRVECIDLAPATVSRARQRHDSLSATVADVRRLPYADGCFDAIVSTSTLDHFSNAESIRAGLLELRRVLAPDGRLVLTLDNLDHPFVALRNNLPFGVLNAVGLVPYYVGVMLGSTQLLSLLGKVGFEVIESTTILHCPRVLAVPAARIVSFLPWPLQIRSPFLRALARFEMAERWPSRFRTGHFLAVLAKPRLSAAVDNEPWSAGGPDRLPGSGG